MYRLSVFSAVVTICMLSSCIKDAPLSPEADIDSFVIDSAALTGSTFIDQSNNKILLYLQQDAYTNGVAPRITISAGGTISPASGDSIHFNSPIIYTVTSADKQSQKKYTVEVVSVGSWTFNFEQWQSNSTDKYQYPVENNGSLVWATGNPGVALAGVTKDPLSYPTRSTTDGYNGTTAAELVTIPGTSLSALAGVRLFAGSLFTGNFNIQNAFTNPLGATEFGQPYRGRAVRFTGYYKYAPGPSYQDKNGNIITGITDSCSIYAVLFKGTQRLDGTNILSSSRIIARAELPDGSARSSFTRFDIPFDYVPGADLSGDLMLAIVASSSRNGNIYNGAVGSRLIVDSLRIIHE